VPLNTRGLTRLRRIQGRDRPSDLRFTPPGNSNKHVRLSIGCPWTQSSARRPSGPCSAHSCGSPRRERVNRHKDSDLDSHCTARTLVIYHHYLSVH
jgi:hypothetical protein